jgi:hypothetical protein
MMAAALKRRSTSTRLNSAISQKTVIFTFINCLEVMQIIDITKQNELRS